MVYLSMILFTVLRFTERQSCYLKYIMSTHIEGRRPAVEKTGK